MTTFLGALIILVLGGAACLLLQRAAKAARVLGCLTALTGCILGLIVPLQVLLAGREFSFYASWSLPYGALAIGLDALSAFFCLPILVLTAAAALYGVEYLSPIPAIAGAANSRNGSTSSGQAWFFYNLLTASMLVVVTARNAVLFLLAWETMSLASFFLVILEYHKDSVRRAGWTYLAAMHVGSACLLAMFLLLGRSAASLDFVAFSGSISAGMASLLFLLALVGFGVKAGVIPLHIWLPEAHPAAPSHVSAVMSGVMIKTGIYGLLRVLLMIGPVALWWGQLLVIIGIVSGILGVLFALAQHDCKRLLAYHSIENIGIIIMAIGLGCLGVTGGYPALAFLGFGGGLLHVMNHALFKGLLFLSTGAVLRATGTSEINHLGGLLKRMPFTGLMFLLGSVAICALPPLNGFISEFLVYVGALLGVTALEASLTARFHGIAVIAALALIGGLAAACFTKVFGVVFLGEPRTVRASSAFEIGWPMKIAMGSLALTCLGIGLCAPLALMLVAPAVKLLVPLPGDWHGAIASHWIDILSKIAFCSLVLIALVGAAAILRARLLRRYGTRRALTWDCGYVKPSPRLQYTASSFAQPLTVFFRGLLGTRRRFVPPEGFFPRASSFASETPDFYREAMYGPLFAFVNKLLAKFRWLQHGRLNLYVLSIVLALLGLLVWKLK